MAPNRITPQDVADNIVSETYTVLPNGRTTICQLTLKNGFTVEGQSACVSIENFNPEIGNPIARENAMHEIWPLMGYELASRLASQQPMTFLDRLRIERQELEEKYQKLVQFIHKDNAQFDALSAGQQDLLRQQANIMSQYVSILTRRLELIEKE